MQTLTPHRHTIADAIEKLMDGIFIALARPYTIGIESALPNLNPESVPSLGVGVLARRR
jgi:hypothetical protein